MKKIFVFFLVFFMLCGFAQAQDRLPLTDKQAAYCRSVIEYDPSYSARDIKDMDGFCRCLHVPGNTSLDCENIFLLRRDDGTCQAFKDSVENLDDSSKVDCTCFKKYQDQILDIMNSSSMAELDKEEKVNALSSKISERCIKSSYARGEDE